MKVTFEDRPALHGTRIAIATLTPHGNSTP